MMKRAGSFILTFSILAAMVSCEKIRQLPPEPLIEFRSFTMFDSTDILGNTYKAGILEFYFEDGDGDIGMAQPYSDETNPDTTNLTFHLYRKLNGEFGLPSDTIGYRVPMIERIGQNKVIQGTIEITFFYIGTNYNDTIMYEFFLKDRAGNSSNVERSCEIGFLGEGGCTGSSAEL